MHRTFYARAAMPLAVAALALAASVALGADATSAPAGTRPAASVEERAQVEGITTGVSRAAAGPMAAAATTGAAPASALGLAAQTLGWAGPVSSAVPKAAPTSIVTASLAAPATTTTHRAATTTTTTTATTKVWWASYRGTNHVWMPTLGISKAVSFYACSRTTYPGNYVYRWGCAGTNNVYLFGHNTSVFSPLYQAYRSGTLRTGLPVVYADGSGRTRLYRVVAWRVVLATDTAWATASLSVPSMTLQTCVSATAGPYRLVVRLVSVAK